MKKAGTGATVPSAAAEGDLYAIEISRVQFTHTNFIICVLVLIVLRIEMIECYYFLTNGLFS